MGEANLFVFLGERAADVHARMENLRAEGMTSDAVDEPDLQCQSYVCEDTESLKKTLSSSLPAFYRTLRADNRLLLVWLVTDACTETSAEGATASVDLIAGAAGELYGESFFRLNTVLIVPKPATPSPWVRDALDKLSREERLYHFAWVVSNGPQALTDQQVAGQVAQFLLLAATGAFTRYFQAHGQLDTFRTRLGTFGLSGLEAPAAECLRKKAHSISIQAVNLMLSETQPSLSAETKEHSLSGLVDKICAGAESSVLNKLKFDDDCGVSDAQYPDRLWSIYHFFTLGRATTAWKLIQINAELVWQELKGSADRQFSAALKECVAPAQMRVLLAGMAKSAENALAGTGPTRKMIEEVGAGIGKYMSACRSLPRIPAMLLFWMAFLFIAGFWGCRPLVMVTVPALSYLPQNTMNILMLSAWLILAVLLTFGVYGLQIKRRRLARRAATHTVVEAVTGTYKLEAHNLAVGLLKKLRDYTGEKDIPSSLPGRLERYIANLTEVRRLLAEGVDHPQPNRACFRSCAVDAEWRDPSSTWDRLLSNWVRNGLHEAIMPLDPQEVREKFLAEYGRHLRLLGTLIDYWNRQPEEIRGEAGTFLYRNAEPLAFLPNNNEQASSEVFLFASEGEELDPVEILRLPNVSRPEPTKNRYLLVYMRTLLGLAPEQFDLGPMGGEG